MLERMLGDKMMDGVIPAAAAARYLAASGARSDLPRALWAYNHARWYVEDVLARTRRIEGASSSG